YIGANVSARASDRYIRPVLVAVLAISSLKLLNVSNGALLGASGTAIVALAAVFLGSTMRSRTRADAPAPLPSPQRRQPPQAVSVLMPGVESARVNSTISTSSSTWALWPGRM